MKVGGDPPRPKLFEKKISIYLSIHIETPCFIEEEGRTDSPPRSNCADGGGRRTPAAEPLATPRPRTLQYGHGLRACRDSCESEGREHDSTRLVGSWLYYTPSSVGSCDSPLALSPSPPRAGAGSRSRATADMAPGARGWVDRVAFHYDDGEEVQTTCDVRIWPNHPHQPKPRGHRRTIGCAASVDGEGAATVDRTHHRTSGPHPARSQNSQANTPSGLRRRS